MSAGGVDCSSHRRRLLLSSSLVLGVRRARREGGLAAAAKKGPASVRLLSLQSSVPRGADGQRTGSEHGFLFLFICRFLNIFAAYSSGPTGDIATRLLGTMFLLQYTGTPFKFAPFARCSDPRRPGKCFLLPRAELTPLQGPARPSHHHSYPSLLFPFFSSCFIDLLPHRRAFSSC